MAEPLVKICGITRAEDVAAAVEAGADALGFIVVPSSARGVEFSTACRLAKGAPEHVRTVVVYADTAVHRHSWDKFDLVQVYGRFAHPNNRTIVGMREDRRRPAGRGAGVARPAPRFDP